MSKLDKLIEILKSYGNITIAFSGGVDSTLLAYIASKELGNKVKCVTISDAFHSIDEIEEAKEFTNEYGIKHEVIKTDLIHSDIFIKNEKDRCYHCKKAVFTKIIDSAQKSVVIDGTNADDVFDYRPGMKALKELGIKSPLKDAGLGKKDIYELAKKYDLKIKNKPSLACLATRIPFGEAVTNEKVRKVDLAETYIRRSGFYNVRVRYFDGAAKVEIGIDEFNKLNEKALKDINDELKKIGFKRVLLDLDGYKRGSMLDG